MNHYVTPDLCDAYPDLVQVLEPMFANFGGGIPSVARS